LTAQNGPRHKSAKETHQPFESTESTVAKRTRTITPRHRQAVVIASIGVLAAIGAIAFFLLRQSNAKDADARLLSDNIQTAGVSGGQSDGAGGGLRLCNRTNSRVGVAIGYKEKQRWTTEGWWNVAAGTCETIVAGSLVSRFYYVYAVDYDRGGVWGGKAAMCTRDKMFTINGIEDCVARGFEKTGFFEVDTGEQKSWTVQLTEPGQQGTAGG
jgi:uncharacterized membrane protein